MRHSGIACCLVSVLALPAWGQGVPDSIVAEGVPPIPAELSNALNRYQNTRTASFQGWLGDRREALIETRFADTPQVHHVAFPGGARTQLTFQRERVLAAAPRPGRDQFAFTTDEGGAENYQVLFVDIKTGDTARLTDGKSRNVLGGWSHSGGLVAWSSNYRNSKDLDLYVADPADPESARRVKEVQGSWTIADWSPDDRRLAAIEYVSIEETYVHLVDVADGRTETLTPRGAKGEPTVAYANVRWSKDGRALYWTTDQGSEFRHLVRYDLATQTSTPLSAQIPWDVEGFDLSDDGRTVVFVTNEGGLAKLHVLDLATARERPGPALPAGQITGLTFRRGSQEFGFTLTSARAPGDVYSYDLASNRLDRWTRSETGGLNPDTFAEPALVEFPTFDGRKIPAFVYRPSTEKFPGPRPVLIQIHGGPESQFRPAFLGRLNYLTDELGLVVIHPNVRGSAGYGKSYLKLDNGMRREDSVKDIGALLDWVVKQPDLNASRVAVIGGSYGGYMSLAVQTHYSDRLKAGIDIVGISNFVTFLKNTQSYRRDLRRAEYGDERDPAMKVHLEAISPLTNAAKIKVPLLIVQGKNDPRVPLTEAEQILAAVRKNGGPVWYVLGKDEGHGFAKKTNQDYLQAAEVLFLKRYLLGPAE
ncbi:MAG: S9 family peptidase [Isosphaeraceae bacterium]|nr:S9 family peptidase [Isosphaeraceae bacterium]